MPRNKFQNKEIVDQRKKEIVNTAIRIFAFKTHTKTSVDDITKDMGISHGLFYHYFKNKDALLEEIILLSKNTIGKSYLEISKRYTGVSFFRELLNKFLELLEDNETALLLLLMRDVNKERSKKLTASAGCPFNYDVFKESIIYKNMKHLSDEGKLTCSAKEALLLLSLILDSLNEKRIKKETYKISSKTIMKAFVREEYIND